MDGSKKTGMFVLASLLVIASFMLPAKAFPGSQARRIVCFSPAGVEVFFALGAENLLVGVSDFCVYPQKVKSIPRVGGFYNPNLERVAALSPDLVIVQGHHDKVSDFCKKRKIPLFNANMDSIAGIRSGIAELGKIAGKTPQAQAMWAGIEKDLAAVRKAVAGLAPKKVFVCVGRSPDGLSSVTTASGKSFVGEIVSLAGGVNVFSGLEMSYPEISKEALLKRAPDFVLDLRPGKSPSPKRRAEIVRDWDVLNSLPAVRNKKVLVLTEDFLLLPGPRVALAARTLARTLHPEAALP